VTTIAVAISFLSQPKKESIERDFENSMLLILAHI